jgi:hypothetical protein
LRDDIYMNLSLVVPEFKILARYQLDGKILLLPIRDRGSASGRTDVLLAKNVKGVGYFPLETVNRGRVRYLSVKSGTKCGLDDPQF